MKLIKSDWKLLDNLITKIGFGSYYDLIETLKIIIINLEPKFNQELYNETDLLILIQILLQLSIIKKEQIEA
jgi:hypothetical protein